jgi:hypothetical protein
VTSKLRKSLAEMLAEELLELLELLELPAAAAVGLAVLPDRACPAVRL